MSTTSASDELAEIATALDGVGADLASLRMSSEDAVAVTNAYAALLAARANLNACLDGPPPPHHHGLGEIDDVELVEQLSHLGYALARYARTHNGPPALACTRAALYVDDVRAHLAGDAS